jgi:hypothetical protein
MRFSSEFIIFYEVQLVIFTFLVSFEGVMQCRGLKKTSFRTALLHFLGNYLVTYGPEEQWSSVNEARKSRIVPESSQLAPFEDRTSEDLSASIIPRY